MFKKLRNKFIIINLVTTSVVLGLSFGIIYAVARANADQRPPIEQSDQSGQAYSKDFSTILNDRLHEEREASLNSLLLSLIITGISIEVIIFLISLYLADLSIKPVKTAYLAQKEFIANASHEIKTPLAVIQANLEAADIHDNHWIDNIAVKVEDLAALNNELLTLARIEAGSIEKKLEKINLKDFVKEAAAPLEPQFAQQKIKYTLRSSELKKPELTVNKAALKQLLNILLDNAIKYSDQKVTVTLSDRTIVVKNDGATISEEQLAHIFDRFYQTDKTKNGVGLGLAIAKQLADGNHWKLTAESDKSSTSFKIVL